MTFEEFLLASREVSGFNLTYDAATAAQIKEALIALPRQLEVPREDYVAWIRRWSEKAGFEAEQIGPQDAHVVRIQVRR